MPSLRDELEAACANVRHQIEVQETSSPLPVGYSPNAERKAALVAELASELAELEAALADLGDRDD